MTTCESQTTPSVEPQTTIETTDPANGQGQPAQFRPSYGVAGLAAIPARLLLHHVAAGHVARHMQAPTTQNVLDAAMSWLQDFEAATGLEALLVQDGDIPNSLRRQRRRSLHAGAKHVLRVAKALNVPATLDLDGVRQALKMRRLMRRSCLRGIVLAGFRVLRAPGSAVAQAAVWQRMGLVDVVVGCDTEAFLHGASRVRRMDARPRGIWGAEKRWAQLGAQSHEEFVAAYLVSGRTHLAPRHPEATGPRQAVTVVRRHGGFEAWMQRLGQQAQPWLDAQARLLNERACTCPPLDACVCPAGRQALGPNPVAQSQEPHALPSPGLEGVSASA